MGFMRALAKMTGTGKAAGRGTGKGDGQGRGETDPLGELLDAPTDAERGPRTPAPTEGEWKQRAASAMQQAKMQGKMPGGMAREVERALRPRVDVRSLLLRFFSERSTGDYSWTRPNTRYLSQGLYLPALESKSLGEVSIMVDTSGSVDAVSLAYARAIVESVIEECVTPLRSPSIMPMQPVCKVDRFEQGEPLTWQPAGGGGTDFRPALEAIERDGAPVCAICISDLYGTFPEVPPALPVLWLSTTEGLSAPFGETVFVDR